MTIDDIKDKATEGAFRVAASEKARALFSHPRVRQMVSEATRMGQQVKRDVNSVKKALAARVDMATTDDLAELKRKLDASREERDR